MPVIAHLVQADEDTVRDVIHRFNEIGLAAWTLGGREAHRRLVLGGTETSRPAADHLPPPPYSGGTSVRRVVLRGGRLGTVGTLQEHHGSHQHRCPGRLYQGDRLA